MTKEKNKILIIEDEEYLAEILESKLKKEGYEAKKTSNGKSGYEQIKTWDPDLILLDIMMPEMNGYEVLEKLSEEGIKTPVIIISNSGQPIELEKIKELGAVDYLVKAEFEPQEVLDKIENYIIKTSPAKKEKSEGKIVLVEDDQFLRELCKQQLSKAGFEVTGVIDGGEAVEIIKKEKPDLVLLDIMLPAVNGFEILKELRADKDPQTAKIPIIMLSNLGQVNDINKAMELGANGYLIKAHFTTSEIVKEVRKVLEKKK